MYSSSHAAMLDGCVASYQDAWGPFFLENRAKEYNAYVEDNWRDGSSLTLNLGVRYEFVEAPSEKEDRLDYGFDDDTDNVEPRLGFAYAPRWTNGLLGRLAGEEPGTFRFAAGSGCMTAGCFSRCSPRPAPASVPIRHSPCRGRSPPRRASSTLPIRPLDSCSFPDRKRRDTP